VGLVHGDQPPLRDLSGGAERRRDLRRVVAVVVDDANAVSLPHELEPPPDAGEAPDRDRGLATRNPGELKGSES
jgi:hypothetical protein